MNVFLIGTGTMGAGIAQVLIANPKIDKVFISSRDPSKVKSLIYKCQQGLERLIDKGVFDSRLLELDLSPEITPRFQ